MKTIYALVHDRTIRYVGCTGDLKTRTRLHWSCRFSKSSPVALWLRTLDAPPQCHVLQEVTDEVGYDAEEYWINLLWQVPSVRLLNTTSKRSGSHGGGRSPGYSLSAETRRKIAETRRERGLTPPKPLGERNGNAKLNEAAVREIRADTRPRAGIARDYGVSIQLIGLVQRRKIWKHVSDS